MNRDELIKSVAESVGVPVGYPGPAIIALSAAINNRSNKTVSAALAEMAEEMAFMNKVYRKLYEVAAATPLDDPLEEAEGE